MLSITLNGCYQSNKLSTDRDSADTVFNNKIDSNTGSGFNNSTDNYNNTLDSDSDSSLIVNKKCEVDTSTDIPLECRGAINFPDTYLEAIIRIHVEKPTGDICYSDVSSSSRLEFTTFILGAPKKSRGRITDITGMQCFTNLKLFSSSSNQIVDLSPLSNLTTLKELYLSENQIVDISPLSNLSNLTNLDNLYLSENQIKDLAPLVNLGVSCLKIELNKYDCNNKATQNYISILQKQKYRACTFTHDCD